MTNLMDGEGGAGVVCIASREQEDEGCEWGEGECGTAGLGWVMAWAGSRQGRWTAERQR